MTERAKGLYWVSYKSPHSETGYWRTIAECHGNYWDVPGHEISWDDDCFSWIGPMIPLEPGGVLSWAQE